MWQWGANRNPWVGCRMAYRCNHVPLTPIPVTPKASFDGNAFGGSQITNKYAYKLVGLGEAQCAHNILNTNSWCIVAKMCEYSVLLCHRLALFSMSSYATRAPVAHCGNMGGWNRTSGNPDPTFLLHTLVLSHTIWALSAFMPSS